MNRATLVTTNVQTVRERVLIAVSSSTFRSEYSLTSPVKKKSADGAEPRRRQAGLDPRGGVRGGVHRRHDVHQHPHREELLQALLVDTRVPRHVAPQAAELTPGDGPDLGVV